MEIGTRVRPVDTFDFNTFNGPANPEDRGTVIGIDGDGDPRVEWDGTGRVDVHALHGGTFDQMYPGAHARFGVVLVEEEASEAV